MLFDYFSPLSAPQRAEELESRMALYYQTNTAYYEDIHFATSAWTDPNEHIHQDLLRLAKNRKIAEIGCGRAQALTAAILDPSMYTGCDFSKELLNKNQSDFPSANFAVIEPRSPLPMESEIFDFVFSVFVLEHSVRPDLLLKEMTRICKPGGVIAILCPDYFGRLSMASQLIGWASDSGREKLKRGHVVDAIVSSFTSRILLPHYLKTRLRHAHLQPIFLLNGSPSCFSRPFYPDADAVYVTHRGEIESQMLKYGCKCRADLLSERAIELATQRNLLFLAFEKQVENP
jgi:SAM-dependent methyltransferase